MTGSLDDRLLLRGLQLGAVACAGDGHRHCGGAATTQPRCEQLVERQLLSADRRVRASAFDAGQLLLERGRFCPDSSWPVAALLRLVHDELLKGPWLREEPLHRGIAVTSALARLGEIGLPSDALVRVGLGPELVRAIVIATAFSRCGEMGQEDGYSPLPGIERWVDVLGSCEDQKEGLPVQARSAFPLVVARAGQGEFSSLVSEWLGTASMRDLVAWNYDATAIEDLDESDLQLRGGYEAVRWVWDRFVHTDLGKWSRTSLEWELRWERSPLDTARQAGVPHHVVDQRVVLGAQVAHELAGRLANPGAHDPIAMGLSRYDLDHLVLTSLSAGRSDAAVAFMRIAVQERPEDDELKNVLTFALISRDPQEARVHLGRLMEGSSLSDELLVAHQAAVALRLGERRVAEDLLVRAAAWGGDELRPMVILWTPTALLDSSAPLRDLSPTGISAWAASLLEAMAGVGSPEERVIRGSAGPGPSSGA